MPPPSQRDSASMLPASERLRSVCRMAGEPIEVVVRIERELPWWRPILNAIAGLPHVVVAGALTAASIVVALLIGVTVAVTGRVPAVLVRFQVMTLRERVRAYSYWFALRESHPPFDLSLRLDDPGDDPLTRVSLAHLPTLGRTALVGHWLRLLPHLLVLIPMGFVMDACYPIWILLASANRGWPEPFARLLLAIEQWVVHLAMYGLLASDVPPAFGLAANGYVPVGRPAHVR